MSDGFNKANDTMAAGPFIPAPRELSADRLATEDVKRLQQHRATRVGGFGDAVDYFVTRLLTSLADISALRAKLEAENTKRLDTELLLESANERIGKLLQYVRHRENCEYRVKQTAIEADSCTCGLDAALHPAPEERAE